MPIVVVAVIVVIVILTQWANSLAVKRRQETYTWVAKQEDLMYVPPEAAGCSPFGGGSSTSGGPAQTVVSQLEIWPFRSGSKRAVGHALLGKRSGHVFTLFEYSYEESDDDSSTEYRFTIAATQLPLEAPDLVLRPETFGSRFSRLFGVRDVEFESNEFNEEFNVQCSNRKFAFDIVNPQMMEFLMAAPAVYWSMSGPYLVQVYEEWADADELRVMIGFQDNFVSRIPTYLLQDS